MKEEYKLTAVVKEMQGKLNMKIDSIENDDRERVGNTVTLKEQSCETEVEQRRLMLGMVTGIKEQGVRQRERDDRTVSDRGNVKGSVGIEQHAASLYVEIGGGEKIQMVNR